MSYVEVLGPDAPRAEWLAARQTGIGSSDMAGVLGQSNWQSAYSVWFSKVGPVEDDEPSERMKWGTRLEPVICDVWSQETGIGTRRIGLCRNADRPWQLATPDRLTDDHGLLETKNVNAYDVDEWDSDTIPLKYLIQITHQMDVLGVDHGYVAALIGGAELLTFELTPDPEIVAVIRERGAAFWRLVETVTPPETDGSDATSQALKRRWQPNDGEIKVLHPSWLERIDWRVHHKAEIAENEQVCKETENALREALGTATHAVIDGQVVATWKPRKDGVRVLSVVDPSKRKELTT